MCVHELTRACVRVCTYISRSCSTHDCLVSSLLSFFQFALSLTLAHVSFCALRVDKTHMPVKYEMKSFMEAEFARRLLAKAMVKETSAS